MPEIAVTLVSGDKKTPETEFRDNLPVNMYTRLKPVMGAAGYLRTYPGIEEFGTAWGPDRGAVFNDRLDSHFRVSGDKFIIVNNDGSTTTIANLRGTKQTAMPFSYNTQMILDNNNAYLYDHENGYRKIIDPDLGYPIDACWVDGYYFFTDGEYIYHTDIDDEESITPLKYATAEFIPDKTLGVGLTSFNMVAVFGRYSIEYFSNVGSENFAFTRISQKAHKIGIVATHAKCEINGRWFICGGGKKDALGIYRLVSGYPERVSNETIDGFISQYTEPELEDMRMEAIYADNHMLIYAHLPNHTLLFDETVYNATSGQHGWSILQTDIHGGSAREGLGATSLHRAINYIYDPHQHEWVCGDRLTHVMGRMRPDKFEQYGEPQHFMLYAPYQRLEAASINSLEIDTVPGVVASAPESVGVSVTRDGVGYSPQWFEMYGSPGDYSKRFILRRLGYVRNYIGFRFRGTTRDPMAFSLCRINYE